MSQYHVIAATSELEDEGQMHVALHGRDLLLCKHEGQYYVIDYYCSHEIFGLEGGTMQDGCITCPFHGAEFKLSDGSVQAAPAWEPILSYPVLVENDNIAVSID